MDDDLSHIDDIMIMKSMELLDRCKCELCQKHVKYYEKELEKRSSKVEGQQGAR